MIYGLHVNSGGALIIVTSKGVYALPEDASYAGIGGIVLPIWTKLSDYECLGYNQSASFRGRVYGLTKVGYTLIDDKNTQDVFIS